jgi:hypothetical protein
MLLKPFCFFHTSSISSVDFIRIQLKKRRDISCSGGHASHESFGVIRAFNLPTWTNATAVAAQQHQLNAYTSHSLHRMILGDQHRAQTAQRFGVAKYSVELEHTMPHRKFQCNVC